MIKVAILGSIGSGKSFIAKLFGRPVFNADLEVSKIYTFDKYFFRKLKKKFPYYFTSLPVEKTEIINFVLRRKKNLEKLNINSINKKLLSHVDGECCGYNDRLQIEKTDKFINLLIP